MSQDDATHFCRECGAWWYRHTDGSWSLRSVDACIACNNREMHDNRCIISVRHALQSVANIARSIRILS